jgi:hypothetical protein
MGVSFTGIAVGDVDEDGLFDILASSRQDAGTVGGVTITTPNGTRMFSRPAPGMLYAELSLARIGSDPALSCFSAASPIVDSFDPSNCLPLDATGIVLADFDLDLDLDIALSYRLSTRIGVFTNLLWQLETPRDSFVQPSTTSPGMWEWDVPYDMFCEFNVPNFGGAGGLGIVAASLTPPIHLFPATTLGVLTSAPYVIGPTTVLAGGQGQFSMKLGPFTTPVMTSLIGTRIYSTAGVISFGRGVLRIAKVAETTLR